MFHGGESVICSTFKPDELLDTFMHIIMRTDVANEIQSQVMRVSHLPMSGQLEACCARGRSSRPSLRSVRPVGCQLWPIDLDRVPTSLCGVAFGVGWGQAAEIGPRRHRLVTDGSRPGVTPAVFRRS